MKPHEATLAVMQFNKERRCLVEGAGRDQLMVAVLCNYASAEWEALLSAAPEMARALTGLLGDRGHLPDCGYSGYPDHVCVAACAACRAALTKAGVIP